MQQQQQFGNTFQEAAHPSSLQQRQQQQLANLLGLQVAAQQEQQGSGQLASRPGSCSIFVYCMECAKTAAVAAAPAERGEGHNAARGKPKGGNTRNSSSSHTLAGSTVYRQLAEYGERYIQEHKTCQCIVQCTCLFFSCKTAAAGLGRGCSRAQPWQAAAADWEVQVLIT